MLKIGLFSQLSRISVRMLRHYDEIGLLTPAITDKFTGYRYYEEHQLLEAGKISALKSMGFGLNDIRDIMNIQKDDTALELYFSSKRDEVKLQIESSKNRLLLLDTAIKKLREDGNKMSYNVTVKEMPKRYVASVRKVIPSYNDEGMLWGIMMEELQSRDIKHDDPCFALAVFHDPEYKEKDVDVEIQYCVKGSHENTPNVTFKEIAPMQIASATFKGSYSQTAAASHDVASWVRDNGYEFNGASFFIYHVSPHETSNPDEMITEVCYPVRKK